MVEALLDAGANVNAHNNDGWTPLMGAAFKGQTTTAAKLLAHGANVNAARNDGWTALMLAADDDYASTVAVLLANGADVAAKNEDGETAMQIADDWESRIRSNVMRKAQGGEAQGTK